MRKVTRGGSENFVFTENFQIDNVPVVFNTVETVLRKYLIKISPKSHHKIAKS